MADSKFFGIPFATSGDKAAIPEAVQPSGAISFTQGFGPDYERDPATDPLAKRVPRDETNELYYQITNALKYLQLYGAPEWYATDDAGNPVAYPVTARVRHDPGTGLKVWRSLVTTNTTEPGTDPNKWTEDDAFSFAALEASLAEAIAGTSGTRLITPRRLASSVQRGAWSYAVAGGTANALTVTLDPPVTALTAGLLARVKIASVNTGPASVDVNGLGAAPILGVTGASLRAGDLQAGMIADLVYAGSEFRLLGLSNAQPRIEIIDTVGSGNITVPPGCTVAEVEGWGAGGGGAAAGVGLSGGGGGGGGYFYKRITGLTPGQVIPYAVGAGGSGGFWGSLDGGVGGSTSFGAYVSATGGSGGISAGSLAVSGGSASGADFPISGGGGAPGILIAGTPFAGQGGPSPRGGPGGPGSSRGGAIGGQFPGGGGSGGANDNVGGNGARGALFIRWY